MIIKDKLGFYLKVFGVVYFLASYSPVSFSQAGFIHPPDTTLIGLEREHHLDASSKSNILDSLFRLAGKNGDICNQVFARVIQATSLDNMSKSDSALSQLYWASEHFDKSCDSSILAAIYANLTNVFLSLNELQRVDSIGKIALSTINYHQQDIKYKFITLNNLGISKIQQGDSEMSLSYFYLMYNQAKRINDENFILKSLINLGTLKAMTSDLDSAYFFFSLAAQNARKIEDNENYLGLLISLAHVDSDKGRYKQAINKLDSAFIFAEKLKNLDGSANVQLSRAELYAKMHNYQKAYEFLSQYNQLHGQFINEERVKAVTEMMEKYESEKKARQIQQLKVDNLDAALKNERITKTRNHYIYIGSGILLVALGLWWRLTYVHKSRTAIRHEKDISEGLLLNILPASVAEELKLKGHAEARHFPMATILFSDFKSFTTISETLSPEDLVTELNICFRAFDEIITRHGLEKIKTIGDAYMAAAAVPATNSASAAEVVKAGLEMQQYIISRKAQRDAEGVFGFEMRLGIHSGPVVAGIVGVKKFQYDVWGDTVNIANRMETNSEIGQVNISEATYQLVRDNPEFSFTPRGLVQAKGKGEMQMFFVAHNVVM